VIGVKKKIVEISHFLCLVMGNHFSSHKLLFGFYTICLTIVEVYQNHKTFLKSQHTKKKPFWRELFGIKSLTFGNTKGIICVWSLAYLLIKWPLITHGTTNVHKRLNYLFSTPFTLQDFILLISNPNGGFFKYSYIHKERHTIVPYQLWHIFVE